MSYAVRFTRRAGKDFAHLGRDSQKPIMARDAHLGSEPYDQRLSGALTEKESLRRSRIGGWRLIYTIDEDAKVVTIVTTERRGQVYKRL